jgi:hypothetical protein
MPGCPCPLSKSKVRLCRGPQGGAAAPWSPRLQLRTSSGPQPASASTQLAPPSSPRPPDPPPPKTAYTVARTMFETDSLPKHLAQHVAAMDEIWVGAGGGCCGRLWPPVAHERDNSSSSGGLSPRPRAASGAACVPRNPGPPPTPTHPPPPPHPPTHPSTHPDPPPRCPPSSTARALPRRASTSARYSWCQRCGARPGADQLLSIFFVPQHAPGSAASDSGRAPRFAAPPPARAPWIRPTSPPSPPNQPRPSTPTCGPPTLPSPSTCGSWTWCRWGGDRGGGRGGGRHPI